MAWRVGSVELARILPKEGVEYVLLDGIENPNEKPYFLVLLKDYQNTFLVLTDGQDYWRRAVVRNDGTKYLYPESSPVPEKYKRLALKGLSLYGRGLSL
jgi:hypothetical protein